MSNRCSGAVPSGWEMVAVTNLNEETCHDHDKLSRQAWELAYNLVAETMLEGAAAARPIGT